MMRQQPSGKGNPFSWWPVVMSRACRGALEGGGREFEAPRERPDSVWTPIRSTGANGGMASPARGTARFSVDTDKAHRGQRRDGCRGTARFCVDPDKVHRGQRRDGEGTARCSVDPDKVHRGQRRDGEPS